MAYNTIFKLNVAIIQENRHE